MKYNFYIILFLGWYFFLPVKGLLAQTKKEQIETLIFQKDSLVIVLENERQEGGDRIKLMEARNSIQIVHDIRHSNPMGLKGDYHPLANGELPKHPFSK